MSDCIEWQGARAGTRGSHGVRHSRGWGERYVHRQVLQDLHVPIRGMVVRHRCGNGLCVNSDHLTVGTHQDNMDDAVAMKEMRRGEEHHKTKTTAAQVREVKLRYRLHGFTQKQIAEMYGISQVAVSQMVRGVRWREVAA